MLYDELKTDKENRYECIALSGGCRKMYQPRAMVHFAGLCYIKVRLFFCCLSFTVLAFPGGRGEGVCGKAARGQGVALYGRASRPAGYFPAARL